MLLELKPEITYGPVNSRRLGRSLGINLLPSRRKVCTFDCVYCQYGWTRCFDIEPVASALPCADDVAAAVATTLERLETPPAWLTFSGNGEPTLHPDFPAVVHAILGVRDRLIPEAKTAILSNSTTLGDARIRAALARLDSRIMKLDAGDEQTFNAFNRPAARVRYNQVLEGLAALPDVTIQALIASGPGGNDAPAHLRHWVERVAELSPRGVQIYTLARPTAASDLLPADPKLLDSLAGKLRSRGVDAVVFGNRPATAPRTLASTAS